ncbi:MAG: hypothetical protein US76_04455 [Parcubacteria group bacterium GW2011_GWA2_38_13b]|nr:MAG: hypothetical protein US76_04455 [Parcubacteria group bacterium GW2011_GWA2_38_13b]
MNEKPLKGVAMNKNGLRNRREKKQILEDFLKRAVEQGQPVDKETLVGGKKFFRRPLGSSGSSRYKGEKKMEQKTGGFFSRVNATLGLAYNLASQYSEAKKKEKETPEAVKVLTASEKYKKGLEELKEKLGEFDVNGFNSLRKIGIERFLKGVITEKGALVLLDREAKKRYETGEKVQGRPLAQFAPAFKSALNELPSSLKEEEGIYPTISHSMFLKTEGALKKIDKFQAAMELAERVPEKWRKPFETKETPTTPTSETPTTPPVVEIPIN